MTITFRHSVPLLAAIGLWSALLAMPSATPTVSAQPTCVHTAPNTTQCTTSGSSSITTSPPSMNNGPFYGGPYGGGLLFGFE
jgi:hypothetical protein